MSSFKKPTQDNPLVVVHPVRDTRAFDAAMQSMSIPADRLEARAREVAISLGVDPALSPRHRATAIARKIGKSPARTSRSGPSIPHMNALLDAVESGHPERWRREPISYDEVRAAERATGRRLKVRVPGEDDEVVL